MRVRAICLALAAWLLVGCGGGKSKTDGGVDGGPDPVPAYEAVNTFIGSGGHYFHFGSAFVGACLPNGMAKPGPDTTTINGAAGFHHFSGYHYDDDFINGFSQVHISGTGAADYGALLILPTSGFAADKIRESARKAPFLKADEQGAPGYYSVVLGDSGVRAELTATRRVSVYRFTWAEDEADPVLVLDPGHAITDCSVEDAQATIHASGDRVTGWVHYRGSLTGRSGGVRLFYDLRLSRPAAGWQGWQGDELTDGAESLSGPEAGAAFSFASADEPLIVRIGLSYVDAAGATANLEAEVPADDFETVRAAAETAWTAEFDRIQVEGGSADERTMFYTGMYHALLHPTSFSDVDGRYTGFDKQIHTADGWTYYTDFSMWDTYRCTHSLYTLLIPDRHADMLRSLLAMYAQGGYLPKWPAGTGYTGCMIGTPADVILSEACQKGIEGPDWDLAYQAVVANATTAQPQVGRANVARYLELGYLPADETGGSAARTLEFGVADAAIADWATARGEEADAAAFAARSKGYAHLWDPDTRFLRGVNADGTWAEGDGEFSPLDWAAPYYTEGTAWQYTFLAPHDTAGLAALFGSNDAMADKLEALFATPEPDDPLKEFLPDIYYWHGNEPDLHAAYMFTQLGRPERTQYWVRQLLIDEYGTGPDGIPGNDDLGTMSAWYVFSAAGFYPNAGHTWYWIGSPIFTRVVLTASDGTVTEVRAPGASAENLYVQAANLNGQPLEQAEVEHADLVGGVLELTMGPEPSDWAK